MIPEQIQAVFAELHTLTIPNLPKIEDGPEVYRDRMDDLRQKLERVATLLTDVNQQLATARALVRAKRAEFAIAKRTPEAATVEKELLDAEDHFEALKYLKNAIVARKEQLRGGLNDMRTVGRLMTEMLKEATPGLPNRESKTVQPVGSPSKIDDGNATIRETTQGFAGVSYTQEEIEALLGE